MPAPLVGYPQIPLRLSQERLVADTALPYRILPENEDRLIEKLLLRRVDYNDLTGCSFYHNKTASFAGSLTQRRRFYTFMNLLQSDDLGCGDFLSSLAQQREDTQTCEQQTHQHIGDGGAAVLGLRQQK